MKEIFINYRTSDVPYGAAMLDTALSQHFGTACVFRASRSIAPGDRWEAEMMAAVAGCGVLLAVIGRGWLDAQDDRGNRRLDDPEDFVRREIKIALERGIRVVPVLMEDVRRLDGVGLPEDIAELVSHQSVRVHYRSSTVDIPHLVSELRKLLPDLPEPEHRHAAGRHTAERVEQQNQFGAFHGSVQSVYQTGQMTVGGDFIAWKSER